MKRPNIGGQAVLEGVMMRAPERMAVAVRRPDGEIAYTTRPVSLPAKKHKVLGWPIIRGVANFAQTLSVGMSTLLESANMAGLESEQPSKFEKGIAKAMGKKADDVMMSLAVLLAAVMAAGLFIVLPAVCVSAMKNVISSKLGLNLFEGGLRLMLFIGYMAAVSLMPDIRRTYAYHGAEHMVVNVWENGGEMTMESCMHSSRLHPRCGTSFLFLVMGISVLFFSLLPIETNVFMRILTRLALMPVVAGVSYEVLRYAGKSENAFVRAIRAPGMLLQRMTTRVPDEAMVEVALSAFLIALGDDEHPVPADISEKLHIYEGQNDAAKADAS